MEKKNKTALNRLLVGFAALGTLFTVSGCVSTVQVADNFRLAPRASVSPSARPAITAQPLDVQVRQTTVVAQPVWVMPAGYGYRHRHYRGGRYGYGYGGGRPIYGPNGVVQPTAGTHLGNTMSGFTNYYREYGDRARGRGR